MSRAGQICRRTTGTAPGLLSSLWVVVFAFILPAQEPGQTPKPKDFDPVAVQRPEEETVLLDQEYEDFQFVEDNAPLLARGNKIVDKVKDMAAFREARAYDYVLSHASRQTPELLAKYSQKNFAYSSLIKPVRTEYLRELLRIEGRLSLLLPMKATDGLREFEKIDKLYEAWFFPAGERDPICLVVSELPEGVSPGEKQNVRIEADAYYFKLFHYESQQNNAADTTRKQWRKAPMFLGKSFRIKDEEPLAPVFSPGMLTVIVAALSGMVLLIAGLAWWFRRGDRYVREERERRLEESARFVDEN